MDGYLATFAALAGSAVGVLGGVATTWLTLHGQDRARRAAQARARRSSLYEDFIDEGSRLLIDALTHKLDDPPKLVHLYALVSKLRLFAPGDVIEAADDVMRRIVATYEQPVEDLEEWIRQHGEVDLHHLDILREFSTACRKDMER